MNAYLVSTLVFIVQFLFGLYIESKITRLRETNRLIKEEMNEYIKRKEEKYSLEDIGIFRLRMITLFTKIKDEDEKEEIRDKLKEIIKKYNGKPNKLLALNGISLVFSVLCIYFLLLFVKTVPLLWLAIVVNILVILLWISRKRWLFSVLFGIFGAVVYPNMPGHLLLYIGLNLIKPLYRILKNTKKSTP